MLDVGITLNVRGHLERAHGIKLSHTETLEELEEGEGTKPFAYSKGVKDVRNDIKDGPTALATASSSSSLAISKRMRIIKEL